MARIRTIKPEFFTSEQIVECSVNARILFIGLWVFSDDGGVHPDSAKRLKMEVFPGDDLSAQEVEGRLIELERNDLITRYEVNGKGYIRVSGWHHQKIQRPTFKYPDENGHVSIQDHSANGHGDKDRIVPGTITERSPPDVDVDVEGKGRDIEEDSPPPPTGGHLSAIPECFDRQKANGAVAKAFENYRLAAEEHGLPVAEKLTPDRERKLRARLKEHGLDGWNRALLRIGEQPFLTGTNDSGWRADLNFLLQPGSLNKVIEGSYGRD